jgi:AcrR family transcriptional regulator
MSPSPRRPAARDDRRTSLLNAAREIFAQKGYHAATVDDITRAAGVAKGTFYLYFEEKREVYYEVVRGFLELVKSIGRSVAESASEKSDFMASAERAAHALMQVFIDHREMARLAWRESMGLDAKLERMIRTFYQEIAEVEAENIRRGIELGLFRPVDTLVVAYAHIGMVERVLLAMLDPESGLPTATSAVVKEMMALAYEGLKK